MGTCNRRDKLLLLIQQVIKSLKRLITQAESRGQAIQSDPNRPFMHYFGAIALKASFAALIVIAISASVCAADTNPASKAEGAR